jgi:hypothetical protein
LLPDAEKSTRWPGSYLLTHFGEQVARAVCDAHYDLIGADGVGFVV